MITKTNEDLSNFLFSDEANFDLSGHCNTQNLRLYAEKKTQNPEQGGRPEDFVIEKSVSKKIMVFLGVSVNGTFGLKIYKDCTMDGDTYHKLLQYTVLPELRRVNGGNLDNLVWTQDGAPCHTKLTNLQYLDNQFEGRVVSKGARRDWPARSPDFNPLDFCIWGYLKSKVFFPKPQNLNELEANIRREIALIPQEMCRKAVLSVRSRAQKCMDANGKTFENK